MEEAGLEVGVEIGSPNIAAMLCLFPKVLERGEWQGREAQGVLIVAGASCPHGVIMGVIIYWAGGPLKGLLAWCVCHQEARLRRRQRRTPSLCGTSENQITGRLHVIPMLICPAVASTPVGACAAIHTLLKPALKEGTV